MSGRRVLIECQDLHKTAGTGIATYTWGLCDALRDMGYGTAALFSTNVALGGRDPVLRDIRLNDVNYKPSAREKVRRSINWAVGSPLGIRPTRIDPTGAVVNPAREAIFKAFEHNYAAVHLYAQAKRTLTLYGRFADVRLDEPPDVFHASRPVPLKVPKRPNIYTVHDIIPLRLPYASLDRKRVYYRQMKEMLRIADHIVTVSEFTKRDLCNFFRVDEKRITTTYQSVSFPPGVLERTKQAVAEELRSCYGLEYDEYYLSVGTLEPKKNIGRLVDAFAASRTTRPLIHVGGLGWLFEQDVRSIDDERFLSYRLRDTHIVPDRRVRRLDYVSRPRLVSLMRGARALLFPSLYEGFGLPVLEAMMLGTPVITSGLSSLPEVSGDAALLVDPYDIDAMTAVIDRLDADGDLRAELSARGLERAEFFTAARHQARLRDVYERVL